jgi:hypothetical protein
VSTRPPILSNRALNRALLERQMLLARRRDVSIAGAVEHLLGLQAQATPPPYYGLFSRVDEFDPHELGRMLTDREVVRMTLMRGTVHLVTVADALKLRPLVQRVIERGFSGSFRRRLANVDVSALTNAVYETLAPAHADGGEPVALSGREIAKRLLERGIGDDLEALGNAVRVYAPVVQVPPVGSGATAARPSTSRSNPGPAARSRSSRASMRSSCAT